MLNRDDRNNEHDIILAIKDKIKKNSFRHSFLEIVNF